VYANTDQYDDRAVNANEYGNRAAQRDCDAQRDRDSDQYGNSDEYANSHQYPNADEYSDSDCAGIDYRL
jgi:hypothetical protein